MAVDPDRIRARSPLLVTAVGTLLFVTAVVHHSREIAAVGGAVGPALALALDGIPALVLAYAGYRLSTVDLPPREMWTAAVWSLGGTVLFVAVMGATFLVRVFEGRPLVEPAFPLLVAAGAGGIAGLVAGYYHVRARMDASRSRTATNALAFINNLIRHDLRNDLNVIQGHADLLSESAADVDAGDPTVIAEKTDEALSRIETSRVIADTLVGDPELEPVDLVPVVAEMAARVSNAASVAVETDLPDSAVVTANNGVRSVVDNLIENAVEHNDADDPQVAVGVTTAADVVRLTVIDNGPGIPDERKESLFEPGENGSGGGLSLVYTLVTGYGGDVWIEDVDPRGTRFVVELPRADGDSDP
jgi:signal transduction histidine kinase